MSQLAAVGAFALLPHKAFLFQVIKQMLIEVVAPDSFIFLMG